MNEPRGASKVVFKVVLVCVALGVVFLVVLQELANHVRAYPATPQDECINSLRLIDGAKQTWALEHNKGEPDLPTWADLKPYLMRFTEGTNILKCPSGGTYTLGAVSNKPTCSIPGHTLP